MKDLWGAQERPIRRPPPRAHGKEEDARGRIPAGSTAEKTGKKFEEKKIRSGGTERTTATYLVAGRKNKNIR